MLSRRSVDESPSYEGQSVIARPNGGVVSTGVPRCTPQGSRTSSSLPFNLSSDSQGDRIVEPSRPDSMSQRRERQEHDVLLLAELRKVRLGQLGMCLHLNTAADPSSFEGSMADVEREFSPSLSRVASKAGWKLSGRGFVFRNFVGAEAEHRHFTISVIERRDLPRKSVIEDTRPWLTRNGTFEDAALLNNSRQHSIAPAVSCRTVREREDRRVSIQLSHLVN